MIAIISASAGATLSAAEPPDNPRCPCRSTYMVLSKPVLALWVDTVAIIGATGRNPLSPRRAGGPPRAGHLRCGAEVEGHPRFRFQEDRYLYQPM